MLKGLRVLLVNMPLRESAPPNCAPLGPALLASRLRSEGAEVSMVDLNAYRMNGRHLPPQMVTKLLRKHLGANGKPDLIGLSGKVTTLKWQCQVAPILRMLAPNAMIVSGGGLATEFTSALFGWVPDLDAVVKGEGDEAVLQVGQDALKWRENRHTATFLGEKVHSPTSDRCGLYYEGSRPATLDALPLPAWDLLEKDANGDSPLETYLANPIWSTQTGNSSSGSIHMKRSINTVSSRGCPFGCKFCYKEQTGGRSYGVRSALDIFREVAWLSDKYKVDFIGFLDDNFMVNPNRVRDICTAMGDYCNKRGIHWGTHGRLDEATDPELITLMGDAGCRYIGFGAESASPRMVEAMGKGGHILQRGVVDIGGGHYVPKTMASGYGNAVDAGIQANTTWIMGYPGEQLSDLKHSLAFINWQIERTGDARRVNQRLFTATAYPGTEMFTHPIVREKLTHGFGIKYDSSGKPVNDAAMMDYVLQLDDATKVLTDNSGNPVFYGDMDTSEFLDIRKLLDAGKLEAVLKL